MNPITKNKRHTHPEGQLFVLRIAELIFCMSLVFLVLAVTDSRVFEPLYTVVAGLALILFWPLVALCVFFMLLVPAHRMRGEMHFARASALMAMATALLSVGSIWLMFMGFGL